MKKDLKKWLLNDNNIYEEFPELLEKPENVVLRTASLHVLSVKNDEDAKKVIQKIWCAAQKQFIKDLLQGMDDDIDELFGEKNQVTRGKAQLVAYIASLKTYFHSKYLLLKTKNGE
jgi:hypothetical protein